MLVTAAEKPAGAERDLYGFETLTLVPIDRRLMVRDMLAADELRWLDGYHAHVRAVIGPEIGPADRAWLEQATAPLG